MRWFTLIGGVGVLVCGFLGAARADGWATSPYSPAAPATKPAPGCATPVYPYGTLPSLPSMPSTTTPSTTTPSTTTPGMEAPGAGTGAEAGMGQPGDSSAALGEAGSGGLGSAAPTMIGDLGVRGYATISESASGGSRSVRRLPLGQGSYKIADNESPMPLNRVFMTYNYFNSVETFGNGNFDLHREVIGFERTFLDGAASFGMRLPFIETSQGGGNLDGIGDLTMIFKYAPWLDRQTGNVLSGGLALTVPTGRNIDLADGTNIHQVLFQPYLGGIYNAGDWYVLGFSSVVIPTARQDASFISNDLGLGYRLWTACPNEERLITFLTPTIEAHLVDPLNHPGLNSGGLVGFPDQFTMTAGVHIGIGCLGTLTLAGASPVTGPRPFAGEFICQFNMRY
jgi:hypothetical protein